jgi:hypothetical protein
MSSLEREEVEEGAVMAAVVVLRQVSETRALEAHRLDLADRRRLHEKLTQEVVLVARFDSQGQPVHE